MGDSGEGLIDAAGKIEELIEERQRDRELASRPPIENPEQLRKIESLKLARTEMARQLERTTNSARQTQLIGALGEIDRQLGELIAGGQ